MTALVATTKPGKKYASIKNPRVYEALRRQGMSKQRAARISNAQAQKRKHKSFTLDQLERFVSSNAYDPATAGLIALNIPALPRLKGEQIAPGITRIRGNLCNVHGRYGPCDASLSGKRPRGRGRAPAKPKVDRAAQHAKNRATTLGALGYSTDDQAALGALRSGQQPAKVSQQLIDQGLVERANDGSYRMTASGRAALGAADQGDAGRLRDTISAASERLGARRGREQAHAKRQQDTAGKRAAAQMDRTLRKREIEQARAKREAAAKKPSGGGGGSKKPEKQAVEKPIRAAPTRRRARSSVPPSAGGISSAPAKKPKPPAPKAPIKQIAPALQEAAQSLSQGDEVSDIQLQQLITNGLVKLNKDGEPVLTAAGLHATMKATGSPGDYLIVEDPQKSTTWHLQVKRGGKPDHGLMGSAWAALHSGFRGNVYQGPNKGEAIAKLKKLYASEGMDVPAIKDYSFRVFKDASGHYRWVAQSSTAFLDRDQEIVSTKALSDDCYFADAMGTYGPLRWWHAPGIDLGNCDFNAMHGRVLIESGTFRTPAIAQKVAAAANELEISLGFLHLPTEPDADGVFHHIRRFERSLVPRGKASNRFTAFSVKELPMLDNTKVTALKTLGFSDEDIAGLQSQAAATEKAATDQGVAYKADEPVELPDVVINGVTYKAMPPMMPGSAAEDALDQGADDAQETPVDDGTDQGGLTLSPEDLTAIGDAVATALQGAVAQIMGALDLEKKVGAHVQGLMAPYTAQKDASDAEKAEAIAALQTSLKAAQEQQEALKAQLDELLGLQPAVVQRPSESNSTVINPWIPSDQQLLESVKNQVPADQQFAFGDLTEKLFGNINSMPGQA